MCQMTWFVPASVSETAPRETMRAADPETTAAVEAACRLPFIHESWRDAAGESASALRDWLASDPSSGGAAYITYRAALDREQAAARELQRVCAAAQPLPAAARA